MSGKAVKANEVKAYLAEAQGVERDYAHELDKSRRTAWRVAIAASALAGCAVLAVAAMAPLKSVEPFVIRVDNATGAAELVQTMSDAPASYGEVVDRYWLNQYVLNREAYDYYTIQQNYDTTALLSAPDVQTEYFRTYEGPQARDKVLQNSARVLVTVKSITPNPKLKTAIVRFSTQQRHHDGRALPVEDWIATMGYSYVNAPISEKDRRINPLGFQVTSYRVDPEIVGAR